MPHVWDNMPGWSRAEAIAHYMVMQQLESWSNLTAAEQKQILSKVPKVSNG